MRLAIAAVLVLLVIPSCARPWDTNAHDMVKARDNPKNGTYKRYPGACAKHWGHAVDAVKMVRLNLRSAEERDAQIIAESDGGPMGDPGSFVAVWLDANGDNCRVRVFEKTKGVVSTEDNDWEDIVLKALDKLERP